MKKYQLALTALTLLMSLIGNAQPFTDKGDIIHINDMENMPKQKIERATDQPGISPKRTVGNGIYYTIPGALFGGWKVDGTGTTQSMAMIPPFVDVTFVNQMKDKSVSSWTLNGNDVTDNADENGNLVSKFSPNGSYPTPILINNSLNSYYQFNEDNYWVQTGQHTANDNSLICTYSPGLMMTPCDKHGTRWSNNNAYRNVLSGYGFLSTAFLFGTGKLDFEDDGIYDYTAYGFEQTFNPLLAPMVVDEIHLNCVTYNKYGPIPAGRSIKAFIFALDGADNINDTIATFEATASDTLDFQDNDEYNGQTGYYGSLVYKNTKTTIDNYGNLISQPAVIPGNTPFRIQFEGMNDEGVCVGAYAVFKSKVEDAYIKNGYLLMEGGKSFTFANPLCADIDILGQYEVIDIQTKNFLPDESQDDFPTNDFQGWNVLYVSADGQSVSTEGLVGIENYNKGGAFVGTSTPWFDKDGNANYKVDEDLLPEWVEDVQVDTTYYSSEALRGYNLVFPVCKPLPEGVTARSCEIDIYGRAGIKGNHKIVITQGDGTFDESYLVISENGEEITFFHDNHKDERTERVFNLDDYEGLGTDATMVAKVVFDPSFVNARPTSTYNWFQGMCNLSTIEGLENLNTSRVMTMEKMFYDCSSLTTLDLRGFNTYNVTNMEAIFKDCKALENIDLSSFITSKVESMRDMFNGCTSLKNLDLGNFDTSNTNNTTAMLGNCNSLVSLTISNTMDNLDDDACYGVGTEDAPCRIIVPEDFNLDDADIYGPFQWKGGWFTLGIYSSCTLTAKALTLVAGENANLLLSLDNGEEKANALQFDITLPEGVTLMKDENGFIHTLTKRCEGMKVQIVENKERCYRILAYFLNYDKVIEGSSGRILTLTLKGEEGLQEGVLEGAMDNIILSNLEYDVLKVVPVTFPITISKYPIGDVNHDGDINVVDVMMTVSEILGKAVDRFHGENADINGDEALNISDVMAIVDIVLHRIPDSSPILATPDGITASYVTNGADLYLDNASRYTAVEMTVELPKEATLTQASLPMPNYHHVETCALGGGLHRVVVYSLSGEPLSEGSILLHLDFVGDGELKIKDVVLANAFYEGLSPRETTSVIDITKETPHVPLYNTQGIKVNQPRKGVYIQNNKKVIVK